MARSYFPLPHQGVGMQRAKANGCPKLLHEIAALALLSLLASCERGLDAPARAAPSRSITYLDQGWTEHRRNEFYFTPQGSRMLPAAWLVALERADGAGLFADTNNLLRYGFVTAEGSSELNPMGLPIGFALDPVETPEYGNFVGLTCAACHTSNVGVEGRVIRIDGAPANLDFDRFYEDLAHSFERTVIDAAAFGSFSQRVLGEASQKEVEQLRARFVAFATRLAGDQAIRASTLESGHGRIDALTQIINALAVTAQESPANLRHKVAPTSYPALWLTPQLEFVQWNPVAASPIGRNVGEVLGVFGLTTLTGQPSGWYESSALILRLHALEEWIAELSPPVWDEALFGAIDTSLAESGEALYQEHCDACHSAPPYRMTKPDDNHFGKTFIAITPVNYQAVGTDPLYVRSLVTRNILTNAATQAANGGAAVAPAPSYFLRTVAAVTNRAMDDLQLPVAKRIAMGGFRLRPPADEGGEPTPYRPTSVTSLKAGPLPGIWATGPYLHNGSVATVYELLSPETERQRVFWTGGRELDRENLGFISDDAPGRFRFDTTIPGNRNIGHLYPREGLTHEERMAIIEYLKTL